MATHSARPSPGTSTDMAAWSLIGVGGLFALGGLFGLAFNALYDLDAMDARIWIGGLAGGVGGTALVGVGLLARARYKAAHLALLFVWPVGLAWMWATWWLGRDDHPGTDASGMAFLGLLVWTPLALVAFVAAAWPATWRDIWSLSRKDRTPD